MKINASAGRFCFSFLIDHEICLRRKNNIENEAIILVFAPSLFFMPAVWSNRKTMITPIMNSEVEAEVILTAPISISLNPNGITPLAAEASIQTREATTVELTIAGEVPVHQVFDDSEKEHAIPIVGLYPGANQRRHIQSYIDTNGNYFYDTTRLATPSLPDYLPEVEIVIADKSKMEPGFNLSELNIGQGNVSRNPTHHF